MDHFSKCSNLTILNRVSIFLITEQSPRNGTTSLNTLNLIFTLAVHGHVQMTSRLSDFFVCQCVCLSACQAKWSRKIKFSVYKK